MPTPIGKNQYGDDIYQTPNGQRTGTQIMQELGAANWDNKGDPVEVYNRTAAAGQAPSSGPGQTITGSGGGQQQTTQQGGGRQVVQPGFDSEAFAQAMGKSLSPLFGQVSGFERDKLAQEQRQFEQQLQLERDKLERLGIPELQIRQQLATIEAQHTQRMDSLAEEIQRGQLGLDRGALGLQYLQYASQLAGTDPFSYSDFQRGVQQRGDVPMFLQALAANQHMPTFQGTGQTPTPLSNQFTLPPMSGQQGSGVDLNAIQSHAERQVGQGAWNDALFRQQVASGMHPSEAYQQATGNRDTLPREFYATPGAQAVNQAQGGIPLAFQQGAQAPGGYNTDRALGYVEAIGSQGAHKLGTGSLEQLNPGEMTAFTAGLGKAGYNVPDWLRQYEKSRSPQRTATGSILSY